jgi:hypothetical protein
MEGSSGDIDLGFSGNREREVGIIVANLESFETSGDELKEVPFQDAVRRYAEQFDEGEIADEVIDLLTGKDNKLKEDRQFLHRTAEADEIEQLAKKWPRTRHETYLDVLKLDKLLQFVLESPDMMAMETDDKLLVGKILDLAVRNCKMSRGY